MRNGSVKGGEKHMPIRQPSAPRNAASNHRSPLLWVLFTLLGTLCAVASLLWTPGIVAPQSPPPNPIQIENSKPGTSSWQLSNGASNYQIAGYANLTSVNRGGQINLYVSTVDATYNIDIYRMGWYGGLGGRLVTSITGLGGVNQSVPAPDATTGLVDCGWTSPYVL